MYNLIKICTWFWWGMERDHLKDLGIDGRMHLKKVLALDREKWWLLVNMVVTFGVA